MIRVRRAGAVLAALALSLSLGIAPAVAANTKTAGSPAWACGSDGPAGSGAESRLPAGKVAFEKATGQELKAVPEKARAAAPGTTVNVAVYWHVITNGSEGAVTDTQIQTQIAVLNRGFSGGEGGTDTSFRFSLAGVTRTNNATWYASQSGGAEHAMKQALKQGGDGDLNVYSTSGGAYLGWAYLPEITDTAQAYLDGIVIDWRTMPHVSTEYLNEFDEGDTLVHEAGHWLNLEHTFYGQCNKTGDFVSDTPAQKSASSGCPVGKDTCPTKPGLDPVHNYMDYSDDDCINQFTPGQGERMQDSWLIWRAD